MLACPRSRFPPGSAAALSPGPSLPAAPRAQQRPRPGQQGGPQDLPGGRREAGECGTPGHRPCPSHLSPVTPAPLPFPARVFSPLSPRPCLLVPTGCCPRAPLLSLPPGHLPPLSFPPEPGGASARPAEPEPLSAAPGAPGRGRGGAAAAGEPPPVRRLPHPVPRHLADVQEGRGLLLDGGGGEGAGGAPERAVCLKPLSLRLLHCCFSQRFRWIFQKTSSTGSP